MPSGFFAETDSNGRVLWVWRQGDSEKIARPVLDALSVAHELKSAKISGAPIEAVSDWFAQHMGRGV